jgi:hypothetical protein
MYKKLKRKNFKDYHIKTISNFKTRHVANSWLLYLLLSSHQHQQPPYPSSSLGYM